jgi:L-ascorbate metabolism protein UlaG (beta-lactamase superfamily)
MAVRITWIGHASVKVSGSAATVFIDPWKVSARDHADIILLTHDHYDHYSESDIKALMAPFHQGGGSHVHTPGHGPHRWGKSISIRMSR